MLLILSASAAVCPNMSWEPSSSERSWRCVLHCFDIRRLAGVDKGDLAFGSIACALVVIPKACVFEGAIHAQCKCSSKRDC
jgi:hypothetical protein